MSLYYVIFNRILGDLTCPAIGPLATKMVRSSHRGQWRRPTADASLEPHATGSRLRAKRDIDAKNSVQYCTLSVPHWQTIQKASRRSPLDRRSKPTIDRVRVLWWRNPVM